MMKLFFKILLSIALAAGTLLLLDAAVTTGLKHNKNHKIAYIAKKNIAADLLVVGACESEWGIDPAIMNQYIPEKIYNLSLLHADFAENFLFLKEYLKHQPKPKAVLIYLTPAMFDTAKANEFNTFRFAHLLHDSTVRNTTAQSDPEYYKASWIPFMRYSYYSNFILYKSLSGWIDFARKDTLSRWPGGFVAPNMPHQVAFEHFSQTAPQKLTFLWSKSRVEYFIRIIELLQQEGIPLIAYESPIYYEALPYHINRAERIQNIKSICKQYHIPYLQFDTLKMRYDKTNYFNQYNLTLKGNSVFNEALGKVLKDSLPAFYHRNNNK